MARRQRTVPQTVEELRAEYDSFIQGCIYKISRGNVQFEDLKELRQAVYTRVCERDYLRKYDASKGSFTSYLYWLIRTVVVNSFDMNTRNPLNMAKRIAERASAVRPAEVADTLVLETYKAKVDEQFERRMMAKDLADRFAAHLAKTSKPWGPAVPLPDGTLERRSLGLVYRLLRETLDVSEIAEVLQVSQQSVFGYLKRIRVEAAAFARRGGFAPAV